jgi:deoxyribonuclease-1-like protein
MKRLIVVLLVTMLASMSLLAADSLNICSLGTNSPAYSKNGKPEAFSDILSGTWPVEQNNYIVIASWNVQNLGSKKEVAPLAEVIQEFDVVALQEVENLPALNRLLAELRKRQPHSNWQQLASQKVGQGRAAEYYAFVYRADRLTYVQSSANVYTEPAPDNFSREPFFATFVAGEFDFTLITVHITWGPLKSLRTAECQRLSVVWRYVQNLDSYENDLLLLGDFNRDKPTHFAFDNLEALGLNSLVTATGTRTTFGRTVSGGSWYDHIWIDPAFTSTEWTGLSGTGTPSNDSSGTGCALSLKGVSDHCPVWAIFSTEIDDD